MCDGAIMFKQVIYPSHVNSHHTFITLTSHTHYCTTTHTTHHARSPLSPHTNTNTCAWPCSLAASQHTTMQLHHTYARSASTSFLLMLGGSSQEWVSCRMHIMRIKQESMVVLEALRKGGNGLHPLGWGSGL